MSEQQWPADTITRRKVLDLIPYARNSRTHSDEQVGQIAASIKEWGWTVPVLIDEAGGLLAGHGRVLAAQRLGIDEIPTMTANGWSEAQKKAYVIADNKLALNAGWDSDILKIEMQDIDSLGFNLELTGFGVEEMASLFDEPPEEKPLPQEQDLKPTFEVAVECKNEADQESVFNMLNEKGYTCRILTM